MRTARLPWRKCVRVQEEAMQIRELRQQRPVHNYAPEQQWAWPYQQTCWLFSLVDRQVCWLTIGGREKAEHSQTVPDQSATNCHMSSHLLPSRCRRKLLRKKRQPEGRKLRPPPGDLRHSARPAQAFEEITSTAPRCRSCNQQGRQIIRFFAVACRHIICVSMPGAGTIEPDQKQPQLCSQIFVAPFQTRKVIWSLHPRCASDMRNEGFLCMQQRIYTSSLLLISGERAKLFGRLHQPEREAACTSPPGSIIRSGGKHTVAFLQTWFSTIFSYEVL